MTLRVPCPQCGAKILPETAKKNGGLCMPCYGGYRKSIEAGKLRRVAEREYEKSPERKYWLDLVNRVYKSPQGFTGISEPEKTYFAVSCLIGEVYNGGFDQFFSNSSGEFYGRALEGLCELGAETSVALLTQAKEILFGSGSVPLDKADRWRIMPTVGNAEHPAWGLLHSLDVAFWQDPDGLSERCVAYAKKHQFY